MIFFFLEENGPVPENLFSRSWEATDFDVTTKSGLNKKIQDFRNLSRQL